MLIRLSSRFFLSSLMNSGHNKKAFPLFVSIPHSGLKLPPLATWLKGLSSSVLMCDVDAFVDDLYSPALKQFKIPSVAFEWHRYAVDVNRFSTDISPLTVNESEQFLKGGKTSFVDKYKSGQNKVFPLEKSPSDVHWHKTTKGDILIRKAISYKLHRELIEKYFQTFHEKITKQIISFKESGHRAVYLLDLHSMPSQGLDFHRDSGENRKEVVIGDQEGRSCSKAFRDLIATAYKTAGFEVGFNWPYKGGAVTQIHGQPHKGQEVLQIELNRSLYMDEKTKKKISDYKKVQNQLQEAVAFLIKNQKEFLQ